MILRAVTPTPGAESKPRNQYLFSMTRLLALLPLILFLLSCQSPDSNESPEVSSPTIMTANSTTPFLEIVVYTVPDEAAFPTALRDVQRDLGEWGHSPTYWTHWRSAEGNLRADVVVWPSQEAALAAARVVATDPKLAYFTAAIDTVNHFGHYRTTTEGEELRRQLTTGNLLELALFTSTDASKTAATHPALHDALVTRTGLHLHAPLRGADNPEHFGDLALWASADDHRAAGEALVSKPQLAPYFGSIGEMPVFALFTPVR